MRSRNNLQIRSLALYLGNYRRQVKISQLKHCNRFLALLCYSYFPLTNSQSAGIDTVIVSYLSIIGRQGGTRTRILRLTGAYRHAHQNHSGTLVFCFSEDSWRLQRRLGKVSEFTGSGLKKPWLWKLGTITRIALPHRVLPSVAGLHTSPHDD